jgi:hypothetical protein
MKKWIIYFFGYCIISIIALILNYKEEVTLSNINWTIKLFDFSLAIYIILLLTLLFVIRRLNTDFDDYFKKITKLQKQD